MEPVQYLRALRQWWYLIVGLAIIGFGAAAALTSTPKPTYSATHTVVLDDSNAGSTSLARAAFLATNGQVPARAEAELGPPPPTVEAVANSDLNGVQITAVAATPDRAVKAADTYTSQLVGFLDGKAKAQYDSNLAAAQGAVTTTSAALAAAGPDAPDAVQSAYEDAMRALQDLQQNGAPTSGFSTLGTTTVFSSGSGTSRAIRAAIGGLLGLFLGAVLALVLARFDSRIRTRENAEAAFELPVVAEVPILPRKLRNRHTIVTASDPESLSAEAYRGLRTALLVTLGRSANLDSERPSSGRRGNEAVSSKQASAGGRVVMVVSPGIGEGKTTTAANLAVAFAETGRSVLLLGLDLRRPEIHGYFGIPESPGMTELLGSYGEPRSLDAVIHDTSFEGLRVAPSGAPVEQPGELLSRGLGVIESARSRADIVVIDTAPLLATDDASVVIPLVDDVVVVCRAGLTPKDAGNRARELLTRLGASVTGVALIGSQPLPGARSYYRTDYRTRTHPPSKARPLDGASVAPAATSGSSQSGGPGSRGSQGGDRVA